MKILGIETSCDETAMSVIEVTTGNNIKVLSNIVSSQIKLHAKYGGVVPSLAAREHVKNIRHVFKLVLKEAEIKDLKKEIDLISVTRGPGLGPALLVGLTFARTIAWLHKKPLIGVNHLEGHIYSNWLTDSADKLISLQASKHFPIMNLIVSGGHTELVIMSAKGRSASGGKNNISYKVIGETLDDAVGEAFDKVARLLGLGYPGGPLISKMAEKGNPDKYLLPRPMVKSKNYDFSYSGLKTAVLYLIRDLKLAKLDKQTKADIAASFQKAALEVLTQKTMRAAKEFKVKSILLSGGVSANKLLRSELQKNTTEAKLKYFQPPLEYTGDNAAMIAVAGYFSSKQKPLNKGIKMNANLGL